MDLTTPAGRQELGTRIQSAIMAAGHESLPEFARHLGWSRALIYQYVSGRTLVQLDRLQQIADATGRPLAAFLADDPQGDVARAADLSVRLDQAADRLATAQEALAAERGQRLDDEQRTRTDQIALLHQLCRSLRRTGDTAALLEAAARLQEACRQSGDEPGLAAGHLHAGHAWFLQGELAAAEAALRAAMRLLLLHPDPATMQSVRQELLRVLLQSGRTAEARAEATALARSDLWWPRWSGRVSLAAIAAQTGDPTDAAAQLDAADEIIATADEPPARLLTARTYVLSNRATLALVSGDYARADELSAELRAVAGQAGALDQLREAELNQALAALRGGRLKRAAEMLKLLEEWAALAGDKRLAALVLVFRSEAACRCGKFDRARRLARAAAQDATTHGQAQVALEADLALAQADLADGRLPDATDRLEDCVRRATDLAYRRPELHARLLLATLPGAPADALPAVGDRLEAHGLADLHVQAQCARARALPAGAAEPLLAAAAPAARTLGDLWTAHAALLALGHARLDQGDTSAATAHLAAAQALRRRRLGRLSCPPLAAAERALAARLPSPAPDASGASSPDSLEQTDEP